MATLPTISFAIPTYNFGSFLSQSVDSIYKGLFPWSIDQLEVVIVDGASDDDTPIVVSQLQSRYPNIHYERRTRRGGIDFDLNHTVSLCRHDYVWMLSADDVLSEDWGSALSRTLKAFQPDVALVAAKLCNLSMQEIRDNLIFRAQSDDVVLHFDLSDQAELSRYLRESVTLESLFSYMSAVVVKRSTWTALVVREDYYGSCWAHCARLIPLLVDSRWNARVVYVNDFVLRKRTGNDSFMEKGLVNRLAITVEGWERLLAEYFVEPQLHALAWKLVTRDASLLVYGYAKLTATSSSQSGRLMALAQTLYLRNCKSGISRFKYFILWSTPRIPSLKPWLAVIVPSLNTVRHQIKAFLSKI